MKHYHNKQKQQLIVDIHGLRQEVEKLRVRKCKSLTDYSRMEYLSDRIKHKQQQLKEIL